MTESLETAILRTDLEAECPRCEYPMWIRFSEVVAQSTVLCPCCHLRVELIDDRGSASTAGAEVTAGINNALDRLR